MTPSAHRDTFAHDNLPPQAEWPEFLFDRPELQYPDRLNCAIELLDRTVERGLGDKPCLRAPGVSWTYADLLDHTNRIAAVLVDDLGLVPGNRVLLRSANNPMMAACWLAVAKAGGVVVAVMPLLRARELAAIIDKAQVGLALCDEDLCEELASAQTSAPVLSRLVPFGRPEAELERLMETKDGTFTACDTASDDVVLIAFTSGTTGVPKGTLHFHRDVMAICDCFPRSILRASPELLADAIARFKATVCFSTPLAYRAMLSQASSAELSSLTKCVSAGETLPVPVFQAWEDATGIRIIDGIGATEILHIFISSPESEIRPGATGRVVPGYKARVLDDDGRPLPTGSVGRLAVRGPTGCRYLADERQKGYVFDGWNVTGDAYRMDEDGYFWFQARADDMIVSAGYNIAGPEVEAVLLEHPGVAECAVVAAPDTERGHIVKAFVIAAQDRAANADLAAELQDFVKQRIAPYKYPRAVEFLDALPKSGTGKIQRFVLRQREVELARAAPGHAEQT